MNEEWKDIKGYEGLYQVSNLGRVRSFDKEVIQKHYSGCNSKHIYKGRILKLRKQKNGYLIAYLTINKVQRKYFVHRLVAASFLHKEIDKNYVNHLDGNPTNNNVNNLVWCTQSENIKYAYDNGTKIPPHQRKIEQYDLNGFYIKTWNSQSEIERELKIKQANISKVCLGKRNHTGGYVWKYAE